MVESDHVTHKHADDCVPMQAVVLVSSSVRQVDCASQSATSVTDTTTVETTPTNRTAASPHRRPVYVRLDSRRHVALLCLHSHIQLEIKIFLQLVLFPRAPGDIK